MRSLAIALVASSLCAQAAFAAEKAKPVSYVCNFPTIRMSLIFVVTELKDEKFTAATLVGNNGTETVLPIPVGPQFHSWSRS